MCPISGVSATDPLRRAPGSSDLSLRRGPGGDDRPTQHGGKSGGGEGRHGQSPLRPPLQLDRQPDQRAAEARQPAGVRGQTSATLYQYKGFYFEKLYQSMLEIQLQMTKIHDFFYSLKR